MFSNFLLKIESLHSIQRKMQDLKIQRSDDKGEIERYEAQIKSQMENMSAINGKASSTTNTEHSKANLQSVDDKPSNQELEAGESVGDTTEKLATTIMQRGLKDQVNLESVQYIPFKKSAESI